MKGRRLGTLCIATLAAGLGAGCGSGRSVGVMAGDPTGVTFLQLSKRGSGPTAALGLGPLDEDTIKGHVDWITHCGRLRRAGTAFYFGAGVSLVLEDGPRGDHTDAALRVPLGFTYVLFSTEANLFIEAAPVYWLDAEEADVEAGVGIRFRL